jgi:hypothetical protein
MRSILILLFGSIVVSTMSLGRADAVYPGSPALTAAGLVENDFVLDLWERLPNTPTGTPTEIGGVVQLPTPVDPGYVILMETGDPNTVDRFNPNNWSDVVWFRDLNLLGLATSVQLFSDGCNVAEGNLSCFPSLATVLSNPNVFMLEKLVAVEPPEGNDTDFTAYVANGNTYNIHSVSAVPEPRSITLICSGLICVVALVARAKRRRNQHG